MLPSHGSALPLATSAASVAFLGFCTARVRAAIAETNRALAAATALAFGSADGVGVGVGVAAGVCEVGGSVVFESSEQPESAPAATNRPTTTRSAIPTVA